MVDHDKSQFLTPLQVELVDQSKGIWKLTAPLVFWSSLLKKKIEVPAGFITDFASVPRIPFVYLLAGGDFQAAAVLHDYVYQYGLFSRAVGDVLLAEACFVAGVAVWRISIVWLGVRMFGAEHYTIKEGKMSNENQAVDQLEQYIITFRTAGGEYRRCLDAYGIASLSALILEEEKAHGSRFIDAELLE